MSPILPRWIDSLFPRRVRAARRSRYRRSFIEQLESRCMLTVTLDTHDIINTPMFAGEDTLVALPATDSNSSATISYTAQSSNPTITAQVLTGGTNVTMTVTGTDASNTAFTGTMTFRLFDSEAPATVARFVQNVNSGLYNGKLFYRVVSDFVIQGGVNGAGSGSALSDEFNTNLTFSSRGVLATANSGPDTASSEFFVSDTKLPVASNDRNLNYRYTIFGLLTSGFDTYQKIITTPVTQVGGETPSHNVTITSASVFQDNKNGIVRLSSPAGSNGSSTITVTASDGSGTPAVGTFTATTSPDTLNNPAFLGSVGNQTTTENKPVTFTVQGFDLEKDPLTFVVKDAATFGTPTNVTPTFSMTQASGSNPAFATITLTPTTGFVGTINLLVGVRDGTSRNGAASIDSKSNFDTQAITLTVTAPVTKAVADSANVNENSTPNTINVLSNDTVVTGGTLSVNSVTQPAHGTVAIATGGGSVTYTPTTNFTGADSFTYTVQDGKGSTSTATVSLTVANTERMFRLFNAKLNDYLFTVTTAEYTKALSDGYTDETTGQPGFSVLGATTGTSVTVFRLFNIQANIHYLTLNSAEKDILVNIIPSTSPDAGKVGWKVESTGSFMFTTQQAGTTEVFHLYNQNTGAHIFTASQAEVTDILTQFPNIWVQQRSLGFGFAAAASSTPPATSSENSAPATSSETQAPAIAHETAAPSGPGSSAMSLYTGSSSSIVSPSTTSSTTTAPQSAISAIATIPGETAAVSTEPVTPKLDDPAAVLDTNFGGGMMDDAPATETTDQVFADVDNLVF